MSINQDELLTVIPGANFVSYEQMNTLFTFMKLWIDLSFWIRDLIISTLFDLPNLQTTTNQVLDVMPRNFYNAFRLFYGPELSQHFLNYLTSLLSSMLQLINAYNSNDTSSIDSSTIRLYQSADALSQFFSRINIYWDINQWKYLLYQYIKLKISQIIAIKSNNFEQEASLFYQIEDLAIIMGSYLARGIIADKMLHTPLTSINRLRL